MRRVRCNLHIHKSDKGNAAMNRLFAIGFLMLIGLVLACSGGSSSSPADAVVGSDVVLDGAEVVSPDGVVTDVNEPDSTLPDGEDTGGEDLEGDTSEVDTALPPDTASPTVQITAPLDGESVSGSVAVEVTASDDRGMARVELAVNGALETTLTSAPWTWTWDVSGLQGGPYTLQATAFDEAGNEAFDEVTVQVLGACGANGDCPPSSVSFITPVDGAEVCGVVTLEAAATDDTGVVKVVFSADGVSFGVAESAPFQRDWDTTGVVNGIHVLRAEAFDETDQSSFAEVSVTVTNLGGDCDNDPNVKLVSPEVPEGDDAAFVTGVVEVKADASDDVGVTKVQFFVDNGLLSEDSSIPYKLDWDTDEFDEGVHTLKAIAHDTAGQTATVQMQVVVDRTPPTLTLTAPLDLAVLADAVAFTADASDNFSMMDVRFVVDVEGDALEFVAVGDAPYTGEIDTASVESGQYDARAIAQDKAGLTTEETRSIWLDRPPSLSFVAPSEGETVTGPISVALDATDDFGIVDVAFSGMEQLLSRTGENTWMWSPPFEYGPYELAATATDARGQQAEASVNVTIDWPITLEVSYCDQECASISNSISVSGAADFRVNCSDDNGVPDYVSLFVDGELHAEYPLQSTAGLDQFGQADIGWDSSQFDDGEHVLRFFVEGFEGNDIDILVNATINNCDIDLDGYLSDSGKCGGTDCDDANPDRNPGVADYVEGDCLLYGSGLSVVSDLVSNNALNVVNIRMKIDPAGVVHIGYVDDYDDRVEYVWGRSGLWSSEAVGVLPKTRSSLALALRPTGGVSLAARSGYLDPIELLVATKLTPDSSWTVETVDSGSFAGSWVDMAYDGGGKIHAVSLRGYGSGLRYTTNVGGGWSNATILSSAGDIYGTLSIMAPTYNKLNIAYPGSNGVYLAEKKTPGWEVGLVAAGSVSSSPGACADESGSIHVSYFDNTSRELKYATKGDDSEWASSAIVGIETGSVSIYGMAADGNAAHIVYRIFGESNIKYVYGTPGSWVLTDLGEYSGTVGRAAIAIGPSGAPAIVFADTDTSRIVYATPVVGCDEFSVIADNNCDGSDGIDADGDGVPSMASGGTDCDDSNGQWIDRDCVGKGCADDDGCGGVCGCADGLDCQDNACVCIPKCEDAECGDDGCGGQCGNCNNNSYCEAGACIDWPCQVLGQIGCSAGEACIAKWDEDRWVQTCVPAGTAQFYQACSDATRCAPGLRCIPDPDQQDVCEIMYCDLSDDHCPDGYYCGDNYMTPMGFGNLGYCIWCWGEPCP
jgi:hypothetical protein